MPAIEFERQRFELSCGATLLVSRRPGAPVFALRAQIRGGASQDPKGLEGLAFVTGRFLDQGTERHDEESLFQILEPLGGELSGDANGLTASVALRSWKKLLEITVEVMTAPRYPNESIARQMGRITTRMQVEKDDPRVQAGQRFRRLVYGDHWLGRPAYGDLASIARIRPKDMRDHHAKHWCAKRCIIAVCGDVAPRTVFRELEALLANWYPGDPWTPDEPQFPARKPRFEAFRATREQVHVFLGHLGIRRSDPDYAALTVMDHVLGSGPGFTNRVARKLRDEQGLAYSVYADIHSSAGVLPGMFMAYIATSPRHVETAVRGLREEMRSIQRKLVPKAELDTAKNYLVGSFVLGFERAARRAGYMIAEEIHGLPPDNLTELPRRFAAVTPEDVLRVAQAHLFPDDCCLAAAGPTKKSELRALLTESDSAPKARGARKKAARRR